MEMKDLPQVVIALVLAGVMLGAGAIAMSSFQTNVQTSSSVAVLNEDFVLANNTAQALSKTASTNADYAKVLTVSSIRNATDTEDLIPATNYTVVQSPGGTIQLAAGGTPTAELNGTAVKVNYTYSRYTNPSSWSATKNASSALGNISQQLPTVGVLIGVSLVIGIVIMAVYYRRQSM